jgi:hypothetical protein
MTIQFTCFACVAFYSLKEALQCNDCNQLEGLPDIHNSHDDVKILAPYTEREFAKRIALQEVDDEEEEEREGSFTTFGSPSKVEWQSDQEYIDDLKAKCGHQGTTLSRWSLSVPAVVLTEATITTY